MKVLLDNCVDHRATSLFASHDVHHARDLGWEDLTNGALLASAAREGYEALVTVDKGIRYQQNLDRLPVTVIELHSPDVRLPALRSMAVHFEAALGLVSRYRFVSIRPNGEIETLAERNDPT